MSAGPEDEKRPADAIGDGAKAIEPKRGPHKRLTPPTRAEIERMSRQEVHDLFGTRYAKNSS
jgi:hypothetical protein